MPSLCIRRLSGLSLSLFSSIAMAIEEPAYEVLRSDGPFEIRRYAPMLVAETWVDGDMDEASNKGFRLIANFIFGNNLHFGSPPNFNFSGVKLVISSPVRNLIAQGLNQGFKIRSLHPIVALIRFVPNFTN